MNIVFVESILKYLLKSEPVCIDKYGSETATGAEEVMIDEKLREEGTLRLHEYQKHSKKTGVDEELFIISSV